MSGVTPFTDEIELPPVDITGDRDLPTPPIPPTNQPPNVNSVTSPEDEKVMTGSGLFGRRWLLTVGNVTGEQAKDLSLFDFEFTVTQQMFMNSWDARIKIWNLSEDIVARMESKEFQKIVLWAGYHEPSTQYGRLFSGQIVYYKQGRQNATDTFVEIWGFTHDIAVNASIINTWTPAGSTSEDQVKACVAAMSPQGVTLGKLPEAMKNDPSPRGRVMWGNVRDYCRDLAKKVGGHPFIDPDGKFHILTDQEMAAYGNQRVVILNVDTGMTDVPTRTIDGAVEVISLLNPAITPGTFIQINNASTTKFKETETGMLPETGRQFQEAEALRLILRNSFGLKAEGRYPVGHVKHEGQTRGNAWHSHIVTLKAIPSVPAPPTSLGT